MGGQHEIVSGRVLDEMVTLTLEELSRACRVHREWILELVDEGILEPRGERGALCFTASCLPRARRVWRLQHDLGVNLAGAALALDLMEEIERLRAHLRRFE